MEFPHTFSYAFLVSFIPRCLSFLLPFFVFMIKWILKTFGMLRDEELRKTFCSEGQVKDLHIGLDQGRLQKMWITGVAGNAREILRGSRAVSQKGFCNLGLSSSRLQQQKGRDSAGESEIVGRLRKHVGELKAETRELADKLLGGSERALSRAITLCESSLAADRAQAVSLLQHVLMAMEVSTLRRPMFRIGLTGPPGSGKSSLIEVVGRCATGQGEKVAVLAIDPSSERTGGSILGDKTRMEMLSQDPNAFVRPTPARGHLGGIARNTADAALLCEAGGYTVLIIETVGGGQSDIAVAELVDCVVLVLPPAGGDELQGIKKGVVEVADIVLVNKADGDMEKAARRAVIEYKSALHFAGSRSKTWSPPVMSCSARTGKGIDGVWAKVCEFERLMAVSGELESRRAAQRKQLLWSNIKNEITERLRTDECLGGIMIDLEEQVMTGKMASRTAAYQIANEFLFRGL